MSRIKFGQRCEVIEHFTDYRYSSKASNVSYKPGDIINVDSFILSKINTYLEKGYVKELPGLFEGYEQDFVLRKEDIQDYPVVQLKFKNPGLHLVLPNANGFSSNFTATIQIINSGSTSFGVKYSDGSDYPNFAMEPGYLYTVILTPDGTPLGRWTFVVGLFRQDVDIYENEGSKSLRSDELPVYKLKAFEDLPAFTLVTIIDDAGEKKLAKADNRSTPSVGYTTTSTLTGQLTTAFETGFMQSLIAIEQDMGKTVYLGEDGELTLLPDLTTAIYLQAIGKITDLNKVSVNIGEVYTVQS